MKTQISFAFLTSALVGGLLSSCYVAEPAFECTPATTEFAGKYTLVSGTMGGSCTMYPGDIFRIQKYQAPAATSATIAVLASRMSAVTRAKVGDVITGSGVFARVDPTDPNAAKESARGPLAGIAADAKGVCSATLTAGEENFPAVTVHTKDFAKDGGVKSYAKTHIKYDWKNHVPVILQTYERQMHALMRDPARDTLCATCAFKDSSCPDHVEPSHTESGNAG